MVGSDNSVHSMQDNATGRVWVGLIYCAILAVSAALIGLTYYMTLHPQTVPLEWQWNLRWEHNFAAWWSGSLLALAAVLAFDNACASAEERLRKSWIVLGAILMFLALDEIGSLHERMGRWSEAMGAGTWALAIPLGLAIAFFTIRAGFAMLFHGGRERVQIVILGIGFAILLSVAFQEYLEHALAWEGRGLRALRAMIEEGSELVGIAIVLIAVGLPLWRAPHRAFQSISVCRRTFLIGAVIFALPFLAISADLDPSKGYPSDWLASALFLGAGFLFLRQIWMSEHWFASVSLAGLCALASLGSVALGYDETVGVAGLEISRRGAIYAALAVAFVVFGQRRAGITLLVATLALILLAPLSPLWVFALEMVCGFVAFVFVSAGSEHQNGMSSSRSS